MLLHEYQFSSCFSQYINELIEQKQSAGYMYDSAKYRLIRFDKFCIQQNITTPCVTKELTELWATHVEKESKSHRSSRISVLKQLAEYMTGIGYDCYIPSKFSTNSHRGPYVMSDEEIRAFMKVADAYVSHPLAKHSYILAEEYRVLFRFIYCCGLRVSEARLLKIEDIDFDQCTAVLKHSKGDKDRIIYFANDVGCMCQDLIDVLRKKHNQYSNLLFPSSDPQKPLQASAINSKFGEFWKKTPFAKEDRHPTVHSLRYSFVVARMNRWMETGEKMDALMGYLCKYLGHSSAENTYYYYHQTESAFKIVRQKDDTSMSIIPEVTYEE